VKLDQEQQVWSRVEEKPSQNPYTTQPKVLDTGIQQRTKQPSDFVESRFACVSPSSKAALFILQTYYYSQQLRRRSNCGLPKLKRLKKEE
jgi:hypothetical protein